MKPTTAIPKISRAKEELSLSIHEINPNGTDNAVTNKDSFAFSRASLAFDSISLLFFSFIGNDAQGLDIMRLPFP